ncbi:alpha-glucosidase [Archangium violaceum]|uniref:glycoside hydrolase family 97 catalytic domain-containing protein n=1 Tax=Archangium violaceum TaxID=83451 RepID=UPI002B30CF95|nr:alpha-glucosidase [Archangium violaceum]
MLNTAAPAIGFAAENPPQTVIAESSWTITAPTAGAPSARVELEPSSGTLTLSAFRGVQMVLAPAALGLQTTQADLTRGLSPLGRSDRTVLEQYAMTTGKRRVRSAMMTETRLAFANASGARLDLLVRVSADGVAYRYEVPNSTGVTVTSEASAFSVPATSTAWLLPYNAQYEQARLETTAGTAPARDYGYPSLFKVGDSFVLLTEADVDGRYAGSRLVHKGSGAYQVVLADAQVHASGALRTPWRTAIIGDLATVTESTLVDDLASPARFTDTSWIHPGKSAWSWLSENSSPGNFERQKAYVDFAARNGWSYVLVDEGWSSTWVPELTRYARAKGVDILLWFHWTRLDTPQERDSWLPLVRSWGVKGVKVDFMESDSQSRYQWYDAVLERTAQLRLMINFHGSTIPHGLARTWPHVMTMEAVRGAENWPSPNTNPVQVFTRNVVGSMDYTPVTFEATNREASIAHEVALSVAYESGWQHLADKPEVYERYPQALRFLNQVPTAWDETRFVAGNPSNEAVIARRKGDRWFVGAIAAGEPRTVSAPLRFLGPGQWLVEVVRDGAGELRTDVIREQWLMGAFNTLSVNVRRHGGFAAIICRYSPGRLTCDEPIRQVPPSGLTVTPSGPVDVQSGSILEISGTFTAPASTSIRDVKLGVRPPLGWSSLGEELTRSSMAPGESLQGRWTVQVGPGNGNGDDGRFGNIDLPIAAEFRLPGDAAGTPRVHVEQAVRTLLLPPAPTGSPYVSDLPFLSETNGYGPVERDRSNGEAASGDGNPLTMGGATYAKGLGTHAPSEISIYLGRNCQSFTADIGLDDETTQTGSVTFKVLGDGGVLYDSGVIRSKGPARSISVGVSGVRMLSLQVTDGGDGKNFDHADWANARLSCDES